MTSCGAVRMGEVIRLTTKNIPNNATATYHLFAKKLRRYNEIYKKSSTTAESRVTTPSSSKQVSDVMGDNARIFRSDEVAML